MPVLVTLGAVAVAALFGWALWDTYMEGPWTRDGRVRAYAVTVAAEVSGQIVQLAINDNQFVHKGDLLMTIDPRDYAVAVDLEQAGLDGAQATMRDRELQSRRRAELTTLSVSQEEQQQYATEALAAKAQYEQALASLARAKINLQRTTVQSPVNGWVTNLLTRQGDYADTGQRVVTIVDADSFWVDAYFEETNLRGIRAGDVARIRLMGGNKVLPGHVDSVARAIAVGNADPSAAGLATVNPIFTWVRLAQRIPVRIHIDSIPADVPLSAGMSATVEVDVPAGRPVTAPSPAPPSSAPPPSPPPAGAAAPKPPA